VALGLLWGAWRLPLLDITAKSVLFTWVFLHTNGSALLAVLFHATTNVFAVLPIGTEGGDLPLPLVATALKWVLVALILTRADLRRRLRPREPITPLLQAVLVDSATPYDRTQWSTLVRSTSVASPGVGPDQWPTLMRDARGWPTE
jgi:hypothetical protein